MWTSSDLVKITIVATVVLHNFAIDMNEPLLVNKIILLKKCSRLMIISINK